MESTKLDRVSNEKIRELTAVKMWLRDRAEQVILKRYGHILRMEKVRYF